MSAQTPSPTSSSSSHSNSHSNATGYQQQRQYVLDVAPPLAAARSSANSDDEIEVISFGSGAANNSKRKSERAGSFPSQSRDPFKVRDGLQPRKASSGVYTPNTFPGPASTRSETSSLCRTPSTASTASSQPSPPATTCNSARNSRGFGGLKRISVGFGSSSSSQQQQQRHSLISSPTVLSVPSSLSERVLTPVARTSSSGHTDYTAPSEASTGRRYGHSPTSSTHSASSISPPATPTTPTESAARIISPSASSPNLLDKASSNSSPTAPPKRTRRKPVPQMDVDLITRLERLEMEAK